MKQSVLDLQTNINEVLGESVVTSVIQFDELTIELSPSQALSAFTQIKKTLGFEQLIDVCGVDYLAYGEANWETHKSPNTGFSRGVFDFEQDTENEQLTQPRRFAAVYHLLSIEHNLRLRVKVYPDNTEMPIVPSVVDIWNCANWFEREAFDLYGIIFEGHPDLRRLLTDYGFVGHPLRKDFPLVGQVEMRYDSEKQRVIYEPVSIENRVNVPRVIREDETAQG